MNAEPGNRDLPRGTLTGASRGKSVLYPWLLALLGWTALIVFFDLAGGAQLDTTGCWVSQTAREMRDCGDWLVPRFSGELRMQKSPGAYWAVMLTSVLRGSPVDEVSARIPNGIWALLLVGVLFELARRIAGPRAAVFTGFATASSALVLEWSHRGGSDLGLTSLITLSLAALWIACNDEPPGARRVTLLLVGYFAAGLGMLYKMPMPLVCVGVPAFFYVLLRNRWRVLFSWWTPVGLLLFVLPWLPWAIAVYLQEPTALEKWRVEYFDRFTGALPNVEGQKHWIFYFYYLLPPLVYTIPYVFSLPVAFVRAFQRDPARNRDGMIFLLVWFISLFAFFTASVGKEVRYLLPALPPLFIMLGIELARFFDPARPRRPAWDWVGAVAVWVFLPAVAIAGIFGLHTWQQHVGYFAWDEVWPPYVATVGVLVLGAALSAWLYLDRRPGPSFGMLVGTMWLTFAVGWYALMPLVSSELPARDFAAQLTRLSDHERAALRQLGHQDSRVIWHSDVRFPRVIDQLELLALEEGQRSLAHEEEIIFARMIEELTGPDLVLYVAAREHYVRFLSEGQQHLAAKGETMPPHHLWFQTRVGSKRNQYVLFGNQLPPWPEPELTPPSEKLRGAIPADVPPAAPPTGSTDVTPDEPQ